MLKESFIKVAVLDKIIRYCIYSLVFLMPIFFLPWTADVLGFNKQALLILLGFVALFVWMIKVLVSGKMEINMSKINIAVGALFLVYILATVFSVNWYGSFWGWPQSSAESLFSLIGLVILYFLISNTFSKKDVFTGVFVISVSAFIAQLIGLFQLLKLFIIPFDFAKSVSFNTVGSVGSLGFFTAILLPLTIVMLILSKKWWRVLFAVQLVLSTLILFFINYHAIWWVVALGSALVIFFGIMRKDLFYGKWMALQMFFLAVSIFFIILGSQIPWTGATNEILLSQKASSMISLQAIKERPIFGSGPGTFSYDFLKFKNPSFSQSSLWNITFSQGTSKVLNDLASTGILGLIALLALMAAPIFYGVKFIFFKKALDPEALQKDVGKPGSLSEFYSGYPAYRILTSVILTALTAQTLMCFLYNSNLTLNFLYFIMMASLVVLITTDKKEYELKPSSVSTTVVTIVFTLVFIFGLGLIVLDGQRYAADVNYYVGSANWQKGQKALGTKNLLAAANLNPSSDLYFRQISQAYLLLLQDEVRNIKGIAQGTLTNTEKNRIQIISANAVNSAKKATTLNPNSSINWTNLGYIYQSMYGLVGDTSAWAINSYDRALKLNPNSPYLLSQEGVVNLVSALKMGQDKATQKAQLLNTAKNQLEKAVSLNSDYYDGLYSLGLVYAALGQNDKAIQEFTKVQKLNPQDTTIPKILFNLKAGLSTLQAPPITKPSTIDSSDNSTIINP